MTSEPAGRAGHWYDLPALLAIIALWPALIVVPLVLMLSAGFQKLSFGAPPSAQALAAAHTLHVWAAASALALPALGLVIAVVTRRPVNAVAFGLAVLAAGITVTIAVHRSHAEPDTPSPEPSVTRCIPRSGSTIGCPGG